MNRLTLLAAASLFACSSSTCLAQYQSDFQHGVTTGWSNAPLFTDDLGRKVLGVLEYASTTLTLADQPAGQYAVSFDFFTINSWDGDGSSYSGPDSFAFAINGDVRINTTFSNASNRVEQHYTTATPLGGPAVAGGTSASGVDELRIGGGVIPSFTYRPRFTFTHPGGAMVLLFGGTVSQWSQIYRGFNDESWALDRVVIESACSRADVGSTGGVRGPDQRLDNNDFIVFIDLFFAGDAAADMGVTGGVPGADGVFDNNDFIVFIDYFFAGCP